MKFISNKDGSSGSKGATFSSHCPNSYTVNNDAGDEIGQIVPVPSRFKNEQRNDWLLVLIGKPSQRFGYLKDAKQAAKNS